MKQKRILLAAIASYFAIGVAQAQIPVTDKASILQNAANFAKEIAKWVEQINHMKTQIETLKK